MKLFDRNKRRDNAEQVSEAAGEGEKLLQAISEEGLSRRGRLIAAAVLLMTAVLSFTVIGDIASNPETHQQTIEALDTSRNNVMLMTAGALGVSTAANMLPADAGKSISEVLSQVTAGLAVILAVILLEKYLITVFGFAAFKIMIPIACLLLIAAVLLGNRVSVKAPLIRLASKLVAFGLVLFLAIPASVGISTMISQTYDSQLQNTLEASQQITDAAEVTAEEEVAEATESESGESDGSSNVLENLGGALASIPGTVSSIPENVTKLPKAVSDAATSSITVVTTRLKDFVNQYIEGFAVMVVTSCLIPIVVLLLFLWAANVLLGVNVSIPKTIPRLPKRAEEDQRVLPS